MGRVEIGCAELGCQRTLPFILRTSGRWQTQRACFACAGCAAGPAVVRLVWRRTDHPTCRRRASPLPRVRSPARWPAGERFGDIGIARVGAGHRRRDYRIRPTPTLTAASARWQRWARLHRYRVRLAGRGGSPAIGDSRIPGCRSTAFVMSRLVPGDRLSTDARRSASSETTVCESGWCESGPLRRVRRIDVSEDLSKSRGSPAPPSEGFESVSKQWTKSSATRASPMGSGPRTVTRGASGRWCQAPLQGVTECSPTVVVAREPHALPDRRDTSPHHRG